LTMVLPFRYLLVKILDDTKVFAKIVLNSVASMYIFHMEPGRGWGGTGTRVSLRLQQGFNSWKQLVELARLVYLPPQAS
jgi:hypothetical protein